ncbi:hypothetical protein MGMO_61c00080 [Methyloglobulus morosus KoM1]|uniref:Lipoprotein-releasing system ATP-binding protein LolD n=1 Tax=Methyloglobulus morosus KoM1 TaxID=1116472 RepID=V5C1E5_9GAMM|nr:hypothetical protein MGMO_61c00080 [Methyloglobulus morosus KoM1]
MLGFVPHPTVLIVTHDHELAGKMGRVLHMEDGVIV